MVDFYGFHVGKIYHSSHWIRHGGGKGPNPSAGWVTFRESSNLAGCLFRKTDFSIESSFFEIKLEKKIIVIHLGKENLGWI